MKTSTTFPTEIIGPYSVWPRKRQLTRGHIGAGVAVTGAAAFAHCIAPML